MSGDAGGTAENVKARQAGRGLAYVCAHLTEIRATLSGDVAGKAGLDALERLRSALPGAGDITGLLDEIHRALLGCGDVVGVYGHVRGFGSATLAGIDSAEPLEIVYRCPAGRCARTVPGPAMTPPRCDVADEVLRWGQL